MSSQDKSFVKILHPEAILPTHGSTQAGGYSLYIISYSVNPPGEQHCLSTGISIQLPAQHHGAIKSHNGLCLHHNISIPAGTIHSDYTGKIKLLIQPIATPVLEATNELPLTDQGDKGFGSTDVAN
eukprot:15355548-Ditylum_brightwellii.AAC.1